MRPAPQGVAGELYLGGMGLARGYLNRPALTAERFVADPLDTQGGLLYRTGDLVRWNGEGQIEYLGRLDHQVKIRGLRIELGEIEAHLLAQPGVREAVVVAAQATSGAAGARLVAYVAGPDADAGLAETLRQALARRLPDYMQPSAIVVLPALALNANGKVDRKALPQPEWAQRGYEPPHNGVEQQLSAIWAELLGQDRVGRRDNFFELGGHSLLAMGMLERMRAHGLSASVRSLFQHPQLADFAAQLMQADGAAQVQVPPNGIPEGCTAITPAMLTLAALDVQEIARVEAAVPGGAANIQDIYPLAPLQEGILFHHTLHPQGDAYATPTLLGFDTRERLLGFCNGSTGSSHATTSCARPCCGRGWPSPCRWSAGRRRCCSTGWRRAKVKGRNGCGQPAAGRAGPARAAHRCAPRAHDPRRGGAGCAQRTLAAAAADPPPGAGPHDAGAHRRGDRTDGPGPRGGAA